MICIKKLMLKEPAAYRAKALTAGMSDKAPRKNEVAWAAVETNIDGVTSPMTLPMWALSLSPLIEKLPSHLNKLDSCGQIQNFTLISIWFYCLCKFDLQL